MRGLLTIFWGNIFILFAIGASWAGTPYLHQEVHECHQQMWLGPSDADYDLRFLNMSIVQHECAIEATQDALYTAHHPELKEMSKKTLAQQQKELVQLKAWRDQWYSSQKGHFGWFWQ